MRTSRCSGNIALALAALILAGSLAGCDATANAFEVIESTSAAGGAPDARDSDLAAEALVQLEGLSVKNRAPKTGFSREEFGPAWADIDGNGCDTRNDILVRDLSDESFKPGTNSCVVATGTLVDKYTGTTINFVRGQDMSTAVQIEHFVALSDAWQKGAQEFTAEQRKQLANDPLNLMAADGPTNNAKRDKDAATWLPPNKAFRCEYVARQVAVKAKYSLWVTTAEHDAIADILVRCK